MTTVVKQITDQLTGIKEGISQAKDKQDKHSFANEMHYQVYRIENLMSGMNPVALKQIVMKNPGIKNPVFMQFLESMSDKKSKEFIDQAKEKTGQEREKLLSGIRKIVSKAQREKLKAQINETAVQKKEDEKMNAQIDKKLNVQDLENIEKTIAKPMKLKKGKGVVNQIQYHYAQVVNGQRALGTHVQNCQIEFNDAIAKYKANSKKNGNTGAWGWMKSKFSSSNAAKSRANVAIGKARDHYRAYVGRIKTLKENIGERSKDMKNNLGVFSGDIRKKLRNFINRENWSQDQEHKVSKNKSSLEAVKGNVEKGFEKAKKQGADIDKNRNNTGRLEAKLKDRFEKTRTGKMLLGMRIRSVRDRISKFTALYGAKHPKVKYLKEKVLQALLDGKKSLNKIGDKYQTSLSDVEEKGQRMDILKADIMLEQTKTINQIDLLNAQISSDEKKLNVIAKNRLELQKLIEGMEMSFMAIDEFKDSATKNLDKLTSNNEKIIKSIDGQSKFLETAKAGGPTIGSSLWNTPGIGKWGVFGALNLVNHIPAGIAYLGGQVKGLWGNRTQWENVENWSITGGLGKVSGGLNGWLDSGGFSKYVDGKWAKRGMKVLNVLPGIASVGTSVVTGITTAVLNTPMLLNSIGAMVTDLKLFKGMLKEVIHYNDWIEGRWGAGLGRSVGDAVAIFFTAGTSAGAAAAGNVSGVAAKTLAYTAAFSKEILRKSANGLKVLGTVGGKIVVVTPFKIIRGALSPIQSVKNIAKGFTAAGRKIKYENIAKAASQAVEENTKFIDDIGRMGADRNMKNILNKLAKKKIGSLTLNELKDLSLHLNKQMYTTSSLALRNRIGKINGALRKYIKVKPRLQIASELAENATKTAVVEGVVKEGAKELTEQASKNTTKSLFENTADLVKQNPSTLRGQVALRNRLKLKIELLPKGHKNIKLLMEKHSQLDGYIAGSVEVARKFVAGAKPFAKNALNSLRNTLKNLHMPKLATLKKIPPMIKTGGELAVWLPYNIIKKFILPMDASSAKILLNTNGIRLTRTKAMIGLSKRINGYIKVGQLKNASNLYQAARIIGQDMGVPVAAMDSSFLGYLHRAMPATINYISKVSELHDPAVIVSLPDKLKVDMKYIKESQKKAISAYEREKRIAGIQNKK